MKRSLREIADALSIRLIGDGEVQVSAVASVDSASRADLVFIDDEKHFSSALRSQAGAIITGEFAVSLPAGRPVLISDHPKLAFARAARMLGEGSSPGATAADVHPAAIVHPSATLGPNVRVEASVVIHEGVHIGEGTRIAAGCDIGAGVIIGNTCEIYPNVAVYSATTIGNRVIVHAGVVLGSDGFGYVRDRKTGRYEKFPQVGRLVIEDDVEIGANATIDRGALDETRIRRGAKIDNLVHIGHNCNIGEDVVIAAQTGLSGSIVIENGAVLGGQVGIGEHARIGEGVMLGGQGGVLPNKILRGKGQAFWGTPAQPLRQYLKQLAAIARLAKK